VPTDGHDEGSGGIFATHGTKNAVRQSVTSQVTVRDETLNLKTWDVTVRSVFKAMGQWHMGGMLQS
jgi:hypothetical protein